MFRNNRFFRPSIATILVCFLLLALGTGVFVWRATQSPASTHTPTPTQVPTPPRSSCGMIIYHSGIERPVTQPAQAQSIMSCFVHAYQQCSSTNLEIHDMGVDTGTSTLYWPQQQGNACHILAQSTDYGLVGHHDTTTETCQGVQLKSFGLLLQGCGSQGDISLFM